MRKILLVLGFAIFVIPAAAQQGTTVGPVTPCTAFGTTAGTCLQGNGTAATVTTNANLTGPITSSGNATAIASQAGTGSTFAMEVDGTWTPTDASGATLTLTNPAGFYRKIGKTVLVWGIVTYPVTASAVQATLGSLPFTSSNTSTNGFPSITVFTAGAATGFVNKNATTFGFGANGVAVNNSVISAGTVYFSGTYPTDN